MREIILASFFTQTAMGALAGVLFFLIAPFLVNRVFSIGPANSAEALAMFRVLALHMPVLLGISSLRASLEGAQRFDISTSLRIPGSLASVVIPAWAASAGYSLPAIMWLLLAVRVVLFFVTAFAVRRALIPNGWSLRPSLSPLREMLGYSGWVAISTFVGPVLGSFDRFTVGSLVGAVALGYYGGASEAANRFLLIPVTAFSAMLPALAAVDAQSGRDRTLAATRAARRQLAALMLPLCLTLFVFGPLLLKLWLGDPFAQAAGVALRILAIGIFMAGLAVLPLALLYGSGRPDLPAKVNLLQLALHIPTTIILVKLLGITGAAIAVTLLRLEDLVFYEWTARRAIGRAVRDPSAVLGERALLISALMLVLSLAFAAWVQRVSPTGALGVVLIGFGVYAWFCWYNVLTARERIAWTSMVVRT
jgi:O-antigen/teichoic acid export membrane protein